MERDSFVFYRSFYEAIVDLPDNIRLEVFTAITEYALYGKQPENLKPFARGMFTLIKPNLDVNITRYENGKKGGRTSKNPIISPKKEVKTIKHRNNPKQSFTSFDEEISQLRKEPIWCESTCMQFAIDRKELDKRLDDFSTHCKVERGDDLHPSMTDARRHFISWMRIAYPVKKKAKQADDDYTFNGGFGGMDK